MRFSRPLETRRLICMIAIVTAASGFVGCGKSKATREAERVSAENAQREQQKALQEAQERAEGAERRAAEAERKVKDLASEHDAAQSVAATKAELITRLQDKVAATLKDPSSAQFRNINLVERTTTLCGEVNAKNSFGGYVGFRPFVASEQAAFVQPAECTDDRQRGSSVESQIRSLDAQIQCQREQNAYTLEAKNGGC